MSGAMEGRESERGLGIIQKDEVFGNVRRVKKLGEM
jgi:hypothetical protein